VLVGAWVFASGCALVDALRDPGLEGHFEAALVEAYAPEGGRFMLAFGDSVDEVRSAGEHTWSVRYHDGGVVVEGTLRVEEARAFPVFEGDAFAERLSAEAAARGVRGGLPAESRELLRSGSIDAVGRFSVRYARSAGEREATLEGFAVRTRSGNGEPGDWTLRAVSRSLEDIWIGLESLYATYDQDEGVVACLAGSDPADDRPRFLECVVEAVGPRYAPGPGGA